jgi:serine/threonine protein kinase
MFEIGEVVCGYEIVESLGQGGFSQIYKARDTGDKFVTLKFPLANIIGDPAIYERFRREFAIGQKLEHPAFPHAIAINEDATGPCLVTEYIEGKSLRANLQQRAPMPLDEALCLFQELLAAIEYLHTQGVYHRDLKPENIIIGGSKVHVVDFGLALLKGARRVTWMALTDAMGTPDYMAPEQIQGKRGDARTDIYALGTIFYEMLTGSVPFRGDNPLAAVSQHLTGTPLPPTELNPSISPAVEAVILKCIRRDPDERYQSAGDLLHDLKHPEQLDLSQFPRRQERQARAVITDRQIWILSAVIGIAFVAIVALIVAVVLLVRR